MSDETRQYGVYVVEDGNPPASGNEFDPRRKVRIEIGFTYPGGEFLAQQLKVAGDIAEAELAKRLGRRPQSDGAQPGEAAPKATRARSKKEEAAPAASSEPSGGTAGNEASDPFAMGSEPEEPKTEESPEVAAERARIAAELAGNTVEEDPFTVNPEEVVEEISDAALNAAVTKKNAEIGDAARIKALIATYNPDKTKVFQLREIVPAQRQDFLDKLAQLKKAA